MLARSERQAGTWPECWTGTLIGLTSTWCKDSVTGFPSIWSRSCSSTEFGLDEVVALAARLLRPGEAFAFSVEAVEALPEDKRGDGQGFILNDKGRFAHAAPYIERLAAANGLRLIELKRVQSRLEQGVPVQGWLVLMVR